MHGTRRTSGLLPLLLSLACAHCVGDDSTTPIVVSTGLPSEQKLSAFDDADAKAACKALHEGATEIISDDELIRSQCAALAIHTTLKVDTAKKQITLDIAKCEAAAKACETTPDKFGVTAKGGRDQEDCEEATANQQVLACDATVSEYEACVSAVLGDAKRTLANIACDNGNALLENDGAEAKIDPRGFAECQQFLDKCPDVRITAAISN